MPLTGRRMPGDLTLEEKKWVKPKLELSLRRGKKSKKKKKVPLHD